MKLGISGMRLALASAAMAAGTLFAEMEPATPESQGVDSQGILDWLDACERKFDGVREGRLHGFVIVRHGKVIAEGSWKPFDTLGETHMLYSHSKSFTSSAIGMVVDDGLLDLDERVIDIFPESVPADISENLRQLRVRDLLTMNAGKKDHLIRGSGDWVREFLARDFARRPGTGFKYDSDATYMCAAIVERKTGRKMMDFLKERMFDKIGIEKAWTTFSPQGIPCGGWGMNMTTREMARFGQLYLQRGFWGGKSIISPDWVSLATTRQTWSGWQNVGVKALGQGSDWEQGYGFQFWRCRHGAYRADGASGQYTVVMPGQDMVVSVHAGLSDMGAELQLLWDHILPAAGDAPLPEGEALERLRTRLASLALPPLDNAGGNRFKGGSFEFRDNHRGFRSVAFAPNSDGGFDVTLVTRAGEQHFTAGCGKWTRGSIRIDTENYESLGGYIGVHPTAESCGMDGDGNFRMRVYLTGDTGHLDFSVGADGRVAGEFWAMNGCKIEGR